ncbi:MAG: phage/plasmid primase, P4 family, partial [Actinomycetota bacterium]|nr:phage/plasmid primase, P4 family [Actinomycetota bacterium]
FELFTDSGQAAAACRESFTDRFIHVAGLGWLAYTGRAWREVDDKVPLAELRRWSTQKLADELAAGGDVKPWAKRLDTPKLRNALSLAEGFDGISVEPEQLDANPDVLNCRNGVVYLPTGDLTPHNPRLYLTKCTNVDYEPAAEHPDWKSALAAIPDSMREWMQTRFGQGITGYACPDDRMLIMQGGGGNGKSTVTAGISGALGDYYHQAPSRLLMGSHQGGHSADLADLRGTRFVAIEETPESGRLDVVVLKTIAGTPRVSARKLYKDPVSFPATHTVFLNTNYTPIVGETDEGTWRRLLLAVFPYTYADDPIEDLELPKDPHLRARIEKGPDQHKAALAWFVEGAKRWYEGGREFPPVPTMVRSDTDEWRNRTDSVATFWNDHLDPNPDCYIWASDLVWVFNNYMRQNGNSGIAEQTFWRRFAHHALTAGALVSKRKVRNGPGQTLEMSRPLGKLDPYGRLPGVPSGQIWAWVGVKFRPVEDGPSYTRGWEGEAGETR